MKTTGSRASAVSQTRGFGDLLYDKAGARPSLDLDFAGTSSLRDKITGEYLVDHTRASIGTYIDSEGLIKEAPINYLHKTDDPTLWGKGNNTTLTANSFTAPDGTQTAHRVQMIAGQGTYLAIPASAVVAGETYVYSIWLKKNGSNTTTSLFINSATTVGESSANPHYQVTLTDEWQRFTRVFTVPSTSLAVQIDNFNSQAEDFLFWQPQVEKGSVATDYIKTTASQTNSAPRFTHERVETGNLISHSETLGPGGAWNQSNLDVRQSYAIKSPSGEFDGVLIKSNTANSFHNISRNNRTVKSGKDYTVSAHFKVASGTNFGCIRFFDGVSYVARASFTLTGSGSVSVNNGFNGEITALEDGWYRCSITGTSTQNSSAAFISLDINSIFVHNGLGHSLYVWGAQFEEASAASTYVPSIDTFTSRASNATYVDSAGLIKTAYLNNVVYSQTIGHPSGWIKTGLSASTNVATAPDGTQTASLLVPANNTLTTHVAYQTMNFVRGALSLHVKSGGMTNVSLIGQHLTDATIAMGVSFNLADGSINASHNATGEIIDVGNGWYRIIVKPTSNDQVRFFVIQPHDGGAPDTSQHFRVNSTGNGTDGIYVWGAMLTNDVNNAGEYTANLINTISGAARYSHDPETLTPTGLYLEPAGTNVALYSEDFSHSNYNNNNTTVVSNHAVAPDGTQTADKLTVAASGASWIGAPVNITSGNTYTLSVWIKAVDPSNPGFFDLFNQAAVPTVQYGKTQAPTEWTRFVLTTTATRSGTYHFGINNPPDDYAAEVLAWGLQVEVGSHATSYIPTSGSQVTRAADVYTSTPNLTETFEPRGLLMEEARTTVATYSNIVGKYADWTKTAVTIETPSNPSYTSPMGTTSDLREMVENTQNANHFQYHDSVLLGTAAKCLTVFARPLRTDRNIQLRVVAIGGNAPWINFDLNAGIVAAQNSASGTSLGNIAWSMGTPFIEKHANGWYRIGFTNLAVASTTYNFGAYIVRKTNLNSSANGDGDTFTGDGQVSFSLWGVQYENGAFPTSYIHNEGGSSLTRSADLASISGDNFGTYRTNYITNTHHNLNSNQFANITREQNAALGYDGQKFSALKLLKVGHTQNFNQMRYSPTGWTNGLGGISGTHYYTYTSYWKLGTPELKFLHFRHSHNPSSVSTAYGKCVDLTTNTLSQGKYDSVGNLNPSPFISVTDAENGWKKIVIGFQGHSTSNGIWISPSRTNTNTGNSEVGDFVYVDGQQIEQSDSTYKATNVIENPPTFTSRLGNATYVDSNGLIKTNYKNETVYSEDFTDRGGVSGWSLHGSNGVTLSANTDIAPNGTQTASKITPATATNTGHFMFIREHVVGTTSIYAKAAGYNYVSLVRHHSDGSPNLSAGVSVNLTNGTVHHISSDRAEAEVLNVGNGWYRIILKPTNMSTPVGGTAAIFVQPHNGGTPDASFRVNFAGDGTSGVLVWGAMHNNNVTEAGEYVKTTGTSSGGPRYSHDPETLVPTGLYLEPAATNKANNSNSTAGKTVVGGTLTASSETAPDGSTTALTYTEDTSNGHHRYFEGKSLTAGTYTWSIFVKPINRSVIYIRFAPSSNYSGASFDTQSKTFTTISNGYTGAYTEYPNGWFRISVTTTFASTATQFFALESRTGQAGVGQSYVGNGLPAFHQWGGQLELGSYPSSYIYTTGSEVTRAADTFTSTAKTVLDRDGGNKEAFFTPTSANSVFVVGANNLAASPYPRIFSMSKDGNTSFESWNMYFVGAGNNFGILRTQVKNAANTSGSLVDSSSSNKYLVNDSIYKGAAYVDQGSAKVSLNGILGSEDTSTTLFNPPSDGYLPDKIRFGNRPAGARQYTGTFDRITFWKTRLPDASLINITNT